MTHDPEYMGPTGTFRKLADVNVESMTEMELRVLKQERYWAQQDLKRSDRERYLELRTEMLVIQEVVERKQAKRVEGYQIKATMMPGAISAEIDGIASEAWAGAEAPG